MKNLFKTRFVSLFGIIALVAVIGFSMASCGTLASIVSIGAAESPPQQAYTGDATHLRGRNDQTFPFYITGASSGGVWGTDVYSDDSNIARAAVHAGIVAVGESKTVTIRILPGRSSYESTTRNGVTTASYGSWHGSYSFVR